MRKLTMTAFVSLAATVGLSATAFAVVSQGTVPAQAAATTTTTLAPPAQGPGIHSVFMYVDTIIGAGSSPAPAAGCSMTNLFQPGQVVVFRMDGVNAAAGGIDLTPKTVNTVYVVVPGVPVIPMVYGNHGTTSYWTAAWTVAKNYPVGIVNFSVHVTTLPIPKTKTSKRVPAYSGIFTQAGLAPPSRLTIVEA